MDSNDYIRYMKMAYGEAQKAYALGEAPVGCVVVSCGKVIGRGHNMRNTKKSAVRHAELIAIDSACRRTGDWRLTEAYLFVTVEPCPMCAGAIIQARIKEAVYGCENKKAGCAGSVMNLFEQTGFNHTVAVTRGVMEAECGALMSRFFSELRGGNY